MKLVPSKHLPAAHDDGIWAAAWAPATEERGAVLLTGSVDETVRLWSGDDLALMRTNAGHSLGVVSIAVDPAGRLAACTGLDSTVRVFNVDSNETQAALDCQPAEAWGAAFQPEGKLLAIAGGTSGCVTLWRTDTWQQDSSLEVPARNEEGKSSRGRPFVLAVAWNNDGRRLACSSMDGTVAVFDMGRGGGRLLHTLPGHAMPVRSLAFSNEDPHMLFTASDDRHIHVYDAEAKSLVAALSGHASWVLSVASAPGGLALVSGSSDRSVRVWELRTRSAVQSLMEHEEQVWTVAVEPVKHEGRNPRFASVSDDKCVAIYDWAS
eukprot:TRINITY_DN35656_c0_g1_i1.p1 TRINITY_DN35656_c0_g1~~TRINITY_DN35656_c0_g1_i1.p1  ORF type:complete len:322 (+),score=39.81 TRINITY_DN35656_c0_g1_i1:435-1400(+)